MSIRAFGVGGGSTDTLADLRSCNGYGSAASKYMTLEYPIGTDFVVTGGKNFAITRIWLTPNAANAGFNIGYGDDGVAEGDVAPTNPVLLCQPYIGLVANVSVPIDVDIIIPAGKYPFIYTLTGAAWATVFGIEI